jgi:hypothetical protein
MERPYRHTQVGWARLAVVAAIVACYLAFVLPMPNGGAYLLVLLPLAVVVLAHSVLTVEVTRGEVSARFGGGWRARRVKLSRVRAARVVANPRYYGFGVRITPKGMLYNVAGTRAVEVELESGITFRLGTDEPERLRDAILDAVRGPR